VGSSLLKPPGGSPVGGPWNSSGAPDQVGEGRRSVARNIDRSLLAATIVILALTFLGILVSVYPTELFSTQSADKPIIPVWESGGEEQAAQKAEDADIPTPTLSSAPTQIETSGATEETAIDGWAREVVEAALREPVAQGPKQADEAAKGGDDLPRAAFENPAARPADPVVPRVESAPSENTLTSSQDPALTSTAQYPDTDVTAQPLPPQTSPPDTLADTEAFPQPSAPPDETIPSS
jgi:hypothetical protein